MVSKAKIKEIRALAIKKFRDERRLFIAEGNKLVADLLPAFDCEWLLARPSWLATQGAIGVKETVTAEENDIRQISLLKTPQDVFAIFKKPSWRLDEASPDTQLILALDGIQDPGNLGTIVRIAAWFGIRHIVCSPDTADVFSPKVVQATMGALANVKVHYTNLCAYIKNHEQTPIFGAFLDGENIYRKKLPENGIIVMGNEGAGIRPETEALIKERLYIPPYPPTNQTTESLNVAIATALICAAFRTN